MSREIKFRAWDILNKAWCIYFTNVDCMRNSNNPDCAVTQFTGLLDKNGKEIFEGDIVEYDTKITSRRVVEWDDERVGFLLKGGYDGLMNYMEVTIIGNIYQNPELLGGEND